VVVMRDLYPRRKRSMLPSLRGVQAGLASRSSNWTGFSSLWPGNGHDVADLAVEREGFTAYGTTSSDRAWNSVDRPASPFPVLVLLEFAGDFPVVRCRRAFAFRWLHRRHASGSAVVSAMDFSDAPFLAARFCARSSLH